MKAEELLELNVWIAENVFGWTLKNTETGEPAITEKEFKSAVLNDGWTWGNGTDEEAWQFQPATKAAYAMDVLREIQKQNSVVLERYDNRWMVSKLQKTSEGFWLDFTTVADTQELAICLFAKKLYSK